MNLVWMLLACANDPSTAGTFTALTYNVHGLPPEITGDDTTARIEAIASLFGEFDVVGIQEDFIDDNRLYSEEEDQFLDSLDEEGAKRCCSKLMTFGSRISEDLNQRWVIAPNPRLFNEVKKNNSFGRRTATSDGQFTLSWISYSRDFISSDDFLVDTPKTKNGWEGMYPIIQKSFMRQMTTSGLQCFLSSNIEEKWHIVFGRTDMGQAEYTIQILPVNPQERD